MGLSFPFHLSGGKKCDPKYSKHGFDLNLLNVRNPRQFGLKQIHSIFVGI